MKDIKQIRRKYDIITESNKSEANKLKALVHAGLFEESKIPVVKKIMTKDPGKATIAEHKFLVNLLESLIENFLSDNYEQLNERVDHLSKYDPRFKNNVTDKDMPVVIILKRKAIRVYPDNQKVALYYSQALDKYVTIPFGPNAGSLNEGRKKYVRIDDDDDDLRYVTRTKTTVKKEKLTPEQEADFAARKKNIKLRMITAKKMKDFNPSISNMNRKTAKNWSEKLKADIAKIPTKEKTTTKRVDLYKQAPSDYQPGDIERVQKSLNRDIAGGKMSPLIGLAIKAGVSRGYNSSLRNAAKEVKKSAASAPTPKSPVSESFRQKLKSLKEQSREYGKTDMALDAASLVPGIVGNVASAGSAIAAATRGDWSGAALGALGAIPVVGQAAAAPAKAARLANAATKAGTAAKAENVATAAKPRFEVKPSEPKSVTAKPGDTRFSTPNSTTPGKPTAPGSSTPAANSRQSRRAERRAERQRQRARDAATDAAFNLAPGGGGGRDNSAAERLPRAQAAEFSLKPTLDNAQQRAVSSGVDDPVAIRRQTAALYRTNESVINTVRNAANNELNESVINIDGTSVTINKIIADKIVETYDSLNTENKKKMLKMMNESVDSFKKIVNFAVRQ